MGLVWQNGDDGDRVARDGMSGETLLCLSDRDGSDVEENGCARVNSERRSWHRWMWPADGVDGQSAVDGLTAVGEGWSEIGEMRLQLKKKRKKRKDGRYSGREEEGRKKEKELIPKRCVLVSLVFFVFFFK